MLTTVAIGFSSLSLAFSLRLCDSNAPRNSANIVLFDQLRTTPLKPI